MQRKNRIPAFAGIESERTYVLPAFTGMTPERTYVLPAFAGITSERTYILSEYSSRPISMRRISLVPAPISYSFASRQSRPTGYSFV